MRVRRARSAPVVAPGAGLPAPEVLERYESERVRLRYLHPADEAEFLSLVRRSRTLHRPWAYPPERPDQFQDLLATTSTPSREPSGGRHPRATNARHSSPGNSRARAARSSFV